MITLLSPAKKLLNAEKPYIDECSSPLFLEKTQILIKLLKQKSESEIASLMHLSPALARLNRQRFQDFTADEVSMPHGYPAILYFQGDVYQSLRAESWSEQTLLFAEQHLRILSGLYGLLKPMDRIQAYRLEMGSPLSNPMGKNLYDFWFNTLSPALSKQLECHDNPVLINLASAEYFKAIDKKTLNRPVIHIHFKEEQNGQQKIIGIHAKRARGLMARFIMEQALDKPAHLIEFNEQGYGYDKHQSDSGHFVFIRKH